MNVGSLMMSLGDSQSLLSQGVKIKGNRKIEAIDISNKNVLLALQIFSKQDISL